MRTSTYPGAQPGTRGRTRSRSLRRTARGFLRSVNRPGSGQNLRPDVLNDLGVTYMLQERYYEALVALEGALNKLGEVDSRKSSVVELRFFGGLSVKETAAVLKISSDTVTRDWNLAKAWLMREMDGERRDGL